MTKAEGTGVGFSSSSVKDFSQSIWFVVSFLFGTALIRTFAGEGVAVWFLLLVLLGMLMMNADTFNTLLQKARG